MPDETDTQANSPEDRGTPGPEQSADGTPRVLTEAAQRALAEAEARRARAAPGSPAAAAEVGGRDGPDPVRYGDWEKNGIASDF
jgi:hypothetical protein